MAQNWIDALNPDDQAYIGRMGELATKLQGQLAEMRMRTGGAGVTPAMLQQLVGDWLQGSNPTFQATSVPELLQGAIESWPKVVSGMSESDEREFAVLLAMLAMHMAYIYAFDLYEGIYDMLTLMMQNAMTNADAVLQMRADDAARLVNKTA